MRKSDKHYLIQVIKININSDVTLILYTCDILIFNKEYIIVAQLLSHVWLFEIPWTAAC